MAPVPLPADFRLRFDPSGRRPRSEVLVGGVPTRVLKLTRAGAVMVDRWMAGRPVGQGRWAGVLAARLVEAGIAHPVPPEPLRLPTAVMVIPVRDDPVGLARTLAALVATAPGTALVVVDDGSVADLPVASADGVRVVRRMVSGGPAAARNTGWREWHDEPAPDVVVFVDAGCVPGPGWMTPLLRHFADPGAAAVAPRVSNRAGFGTPAALTAYEARRSPLDMGPAPGAVRPGGVVPYVPTAVLAVRRSALEEAGGFDETLRFGEDVDLVWRLHSAGWRIRYEPTSSASHPTRSSYRSWVRQRFDYGRSATPLAARHGRAVAPLAVQPWCVLSWTLAALGRPGPALVVAVATGRALTRRAGDDPAVAAELGRLAAVGHLRAGLAITAAITRAWLPPALVLGAAAWRWGGPRARWGLAASAAGAVASCLPWGQGGAAIPWGEADKARPAGGGWRAAGVWTGLRFIDDLAYQAGVWDGVLRWRSARALLPRW